MSKGEGRELYRSAGQKSLLDDLGWQKSTMTATEIRKKYGIGNSTLYKMVERRELRSIRREDGRLVYYVRWGYRPTERERDGVMTRSEQLLDLMTHPTGKQYTCKEIMCILGFQPYGYFELIEKRLRKMGLRVRIERTGGVYNALYSAEEIKEVDEV